MAVRSLVRLGFLLYPYSGISPYTIISQYPNSAINSNPNTAKNEILQQQNSQDNAERIKYLLDNSVDPCEDFFQYACSSKNRGKEFPYGRKEVTQNLTQLIVEASGDFSFLKNFYDSCVSITSKFSTEEVAANCTYDNKCPKEELEKFNIVYQQFREDILSFVEHISPPVLTDDWESISKNFTWQKLSEDILKYDYFLGAFQYVSESKPPRENFLANVFFAPMIDSSVKASLTLKLLKEKLLKKERSRTEKYTSKLHIIPMTLPEFLEKGSSEDIEKYRQLMVTSMKLLGQTNETIIEEDMTKVLNNELILAKLSRPEYSFLIVGDISDLVEDEVEYSDEDQQKYLNEINTESEEITLNEMNILLPSINWIEFVNNVMGNPDVKVNGSEKVLIPGKELLVNIYKFIESLPKREQANLLLWRIFAKFAANFLKTGREEEAIYKNIFDTEGTRTNRSENCVNQIKTFFPDIKDDLLINKYMLPKEKKQIHEIFQQIKDEFEDIITSSEWMSKETQIAAVNKLKRMKMNVGELYNKHLPEILNQVQKDDYLKNVRLLGKSFWAEQVRNLRAPKDFFTGEGVNNAFYLALLNEMQINVGITKGRGIGFYNKLPKSLVYGGFVGIVGHELTHGFDRGGSQYDENGQRQDWWDTKSRDEFNKKIDCMIHQYDNFTLSADGKTYKVNGTATIDENIADNGGVLIAYRAFNKQNRANREHLLPGLNLTAQQLFWVGWAQQWCLIDGLYGYENVTYDLYLAVMHKHSMGDTHAPFPWRVNTVLSNQKNFAEDFECPVGSKLNPTKRCVVWG